MSLPIELIVRGSRLLVGDPEPAGSSRYCACRVDRSLLQSREFAGCRTHAPHASTQVERPIASSSESSASNTPPFASKQNELHGRCHHPIVSGSDGFATVDGVINFIDDVTTGCARYTGSIRL